jgi:thiosulfate dehydrogenase
MMRIFLFLGLFIAFSAQVSRTVAVAGELEKLPNDENGKMIRYGYELLSNTSLYLGPQGKVMKLTKSRMACRNCHLDVGTRAGGNSWLDTQGLYPQYRVREGKVQTLAERTNACLSHNLLGSPLAENSREMEAFLLYFRWVGRGRPALEKDPDDRLPKIGFLTRAANPEHGKEIYQLQCASCHGENGTGKLGENQLAYIYPPLWGSESFTTGASLSRLSLMARFVKGNMPYTAQIEKPKLTDQEAWDVSAFVLSQQRPKWDQGIMFAAVSEKPFDFPIGPYEDPFPIEQHLLGPYGPILDYWEGRQGDRALQATTGI